MNDETPLSEPDLDGVEMDSPMEEPPSDPRDEEIIVLKEETAALKDRLLRMAAEMENLRKRTEREKAEATLYAATNFARDLLSVADNLGRALQALPEEERERAGEIETNLIAGVRANHHWCHETTACRHLQADVHTWFNGHVEDPAMAGEPSIGPSSAVADADGGACGKDVSADHSGTS